MIAATAIKSLAKAIVYGMLSPVLKRTGTGRSVYLSFDDGPHDVNTSLILATLERYDARATFFFVGELIEAHPELVERVIGAGHQVGYHSYDHESPKDRSAAELKRDLAHGKSLLRRFGVTEFLYRPPYGHLTITSMLLTVIQGWKVVMWSVEGRDSFDDEDAVIENLNIDMLAPGSIILLHDVYDKTARLLPTLLENLTRAGLKLDRLSYRSTPDHPGFENDR